MGGNAIENCVRIDRAEFDEVSEKLIQKINEFDSSFHARIVPFYRNKQDFGDIDIILSADAKSTKSDLCMALGTVGMRVNNGNVLSVGIQLNDARIFQVDLISVPFTDLDVATFYFSYNDLNLLTGRIAHKIGLKFGFDGLVLKVRTESGHGGLDINLTKSPEDIYKFLGYDYQRYLQGFDTLDQIFEFVASTKYFNPSIFDYEDLNHINKTRNRKRSTYRAFLEYANNLENPNQYQFQQKSSYLVKTHIEFPHADVFGQMRDYANDYVVTLKRKEKFNGGLVMQWTGLKGKELGQCLKEFEKWCNKYKTSLNHFIDLMSDYEIKSVFLQWLARELSNNSMKYKV